jgi:hypothetical protein
MTLVSGRDSQNNGNLMHLFLNFSKSPELEKILKNTSYWFSQKNV